MTNEEAMNMIEICLKQITSDEDLAKIQEKVINRRISNRMPRPRAYKRKEASE